MLQKTIKWSLVVSLVGGLSGCLMMDDQRNTNNMQNSMTYEQQQKVTKKQQAQATKVAKTSSSSATEPVQKSTPGPKRAAAPQLPVIQ